MTTSERTPDEPAATPSTTGTTPNATFRLVLLGVLVLALLASAGCLVWLLAERRGEAGDQQAARDSVMRETEQFVLRLNTYGPDQLDGQGHLTKYKSQVAAVITPKFGADFEQTGLPIAEQTVKQAGYGRTAKVYGVGVESVDGDSATAIVAAGLTASYPDPKAPGDDAKRVTDGPTPIRWEVKLVKTDGQWLVDDYTPVTGATGEEGQ